MYGFPASLTNCDEIEQADALKPSTFPFFQYGRYFISSNKRAI
jgi:hypothetical protein